MWQIIEDEFKKSEVTFSHMYYNMVSEEMTDKALGNSHGYVHFIYNISQDLQYTSYLRLFSYFAHNNSK